MENLIHPPFASSPLCSHLCSSDVQMRPSHNRIVKRTPTDIMLLHWQRWWSQSGRYYPQSSHWLSASASLRRRVSSSLGQWTPESLTPGKTTGRGTVTVIAVPDADWSHLVHVWLTSFSRTNSIKDVQQIYVLFVCDFQQPFQACPGRYLQTFRGFLPSISQPTITDHPQISSDHCSW